LEKHNLYKGCLEPIVLKLLNEHDRMYGYEITSKVKELTKGELSITEGALYPLLHRLEARGVLKSSSEQVGNRVRKYYSLTKTGKKELAGSQEEFLKFVQTLSTIINPQVS
jgi:PadR family transcriptional regulator, regulatory protein PadR